MTLNIIGNWNANSNVPILPYGANNGDTYVVSVQGTRDIGQGLISYLIGRLVTYNSITGIWEYDGDRSGPISPTTGTVKSVNLALPSYYNVSGGPITTSGILTVTSNPALPQGQFLATPVSGSGPLQLRAITVADLPASVTFGSSSTSSPLVAKGDLYTYSFTDARLPVGTNGTVLVADSTTSTGLKWAVVAGTGTVTSVGLSTPGTIFSVSGSPVTSSGTLALSLVSQAANTVFAGPTTGISAVPTFRSLVTADLPSGTGTVTSVGISSTDLSVSGSPITTSGSITLDINNNAVTYAKMQAVSTTSKLLGSSSTTTAVQEITIGTGLSLTGTTLSATGSGGNVTSIATTAPITGGTITTTGTIGITQADTSTDGYLSSTDWNTFNSKAAAGNYITALTGDVTASGPGSVTATIANSAVTFAKMVDLSNDGILMGRYSSGSGNVQEITISTGLSLDGSGNLTASGSGGTVTSVSGTTNRITSTGGTTPVIDISATFEALLGKVASPLSQFASTTSSQLAGVISDETGSGALVFATSPTLVTPALGTPSSGTLTNCTFPTLNQNTTGSAATLTTARTINGVSFNGSANINLDYTQNAQTGTTYTFALSDDQQIVSLSNASAITATVPPYSSVAFPAGAKIDVIQTGAGKLTITAGSGVTINSYGGNKSAAGQYVALTLIHTTTQNTWWLVGNLIA